MKIGGITTILGWLLIFLALALLTPIGFSLYYGDGMWRVFVAVAAITFCCGAGLVALFKGEDDIGHREGFAVVGLGWLVAAFFGAMPYYLSEAIPSFIDAYFEAMSGFTTTGSTILERVEALGPSLLFWRALTHWLGGMGIIVLSLAILPILGVGGMQLFQAEMPGPTKDRLAPRIQDTARILWGVYTLFTLIETLLLMLGGMSFYDAICHSFATLATGGFSTKTASVGGFASAYIDYVIVIFMFLAGMNFTLHYRLLQGKWRQVFRNEELRFYIMMGTGAACLIFIFNYIYGTYDDIVQNLRYTLFQVWSIVTTTGFGTADFDQWHPAARIILVSLMFIGGMAGSTGGGIKHVRLLVFFKYAKIQVQKLIHPKSVNTMKLDGHRVPDDVIQSILGYLSLYIVVAAVATLVVTGQGVDIVTGFTAVIATLNNIGPGLAGVGPVQNYADIPALSKVVLTLCMVAGRLELYTLAVLLVPAFWKNSHPPRLRFVRGHAAKRR